jgi:uncharacterized membrane protein YphA (DoxX/SURF4 family)
MAALVRRLGLAFIFIANGLQKITHPHKTKDISKLGVSGRKKYGVPSTECQASGLILNKLYAYC